MVVVALAACGKVSKSEWVEKFESKMVDELCKPTQIFMTCFDVDAPTCRTIAKTTLHDCTAKTQLPDTFDEQSGAKVGAEIGECAGNAMEQKLRADNHKFHAENKACSDPNAWVDK